LPPGSTSLIKRKIDSVLDRIQEITNHATLLPFLLERPISSDDNTLILQVELRTPEHRFNVKRLVERVTYSIGDHHIPLMISQCNVLPAAFFEIRSTEGLSGEALR